MLQPLEATFALDRMACMLRSDLQEDKARALLDVAGLLRAAGAPFVIAGGLAVQRHVLQPRFTLDVDVIIPGEVEAAVQQTLDRLPFSEIFERSHRRRSWTALIHRPSNTPVDLNSSRLFRSLLEDADALELEDTRIPFANVVEVAWTKLRTQQSRWPRDPRKRLQDRADLMGLLRDNPDLYERLHVRAEAPLRPLLQQVQAESMGADELPPDSEP